MQLPDLSLLVVMVIFWATYWVLRIFLFKPLGHILEEREARQEAAGAALRSALERQKEVLLDIDRRLTEARRVAMGEREAIRAEAAAKRQAVLDDAREKARQTVEAAQQRLESEIAGAREELRASAKTTAAEIASVALGRKVA